MKGYIYTMFKGADPGNGWKMTDPIYDGIPTFGACMPNIRRSVTEGDYIFSISGRVEGMKQYVVGGFSVLEKINALQAYNRFPDKRMIKLNDGGLAGNIIIDDKGKQLPYDYHDNFESRIENYIIGEKPIFLGTDNEIERGRDETLDFLKDLFEKKEGHKVSDVIGRWRKVDEKQIEKIVHWMDNIKKTA